MMSAPLYAASHAVVADDERQAAAVGTYAHRHAQVARLPRLHRHPRVELAVIQLDGAGVVDDQAAVVGVAAGVGLHDREAAPDAVLDAGRFESSYFRAVQAAHDLRVGVHRQAVQRVFGEHHQVHGRLVAAGLAHQVADALRLRRQLRGGLHHRQLQLHQAHDHAVRRFVESAESAHGRCPIVVNGKKRRKWNRPRSARPAAPAPRGRAGRLRPGSAASAHTARC